MNSTNRVSKFVPKIPPVLESRGERRKKAARNHEEISKQVEADRIKDFFSPALTANVQSIKTAYGGFYRAIANSGNNDDPKVLGPWRYFTDNVHLFLVAYARALGETDDDERQPARWWQAFQDAAESLLKGARYEYRKMGLKPREEMGDGFYERLRAQMAYPHGISRSTEDLRYGYFVLQF